MGSFAVHRPPDAIRPQEVVVSQCVGGLNERAGRMEGRPGGRDPLRRVFGKQRGIVDARLEERLKGSGEDAVLVNAFSHAVVTVLAAAHSTSRLLPRIARRRQRRAADPRPRSRPHEPVLELVRAAERAESGKSDVRLFDEGAPCSRGQTGRRQADGGPPMCDPIVGRRGWAKAT
jgi:hypothetical protein